MFNRLNLRLKQKAGPFKLSLSQVNVQVYTLDMLFHKEIIEVMLSCNLLQIFDKI